MSTGSPAHSLLTRPLSARPARPRLHSAISPETQPGACSQAMELAYFAGKIAKNRLVCKNAAVALAYYGSCRLLVMGSCTGKMVYMYW